MTAFRVLICDDCDIHADFIRHIVTSIADAEATVIETGEGALEAMRSSMPSLFILDMMLPGMQGRDVLAAMLDEHLVVPTIAVSGDRALLDDLPSWVVGVAKEPGLEPIAIPRTIADIRDKTWASELSQRVRDLAAVCDREWTRRRGVGGG